MSYCPDCDWQIEIARRMVSKDHKQRWMYYCTTLKAYRVSESAVPYVDAVSVYWMPMQRCVAHSFRHRVLAHSAIGAF